MKKIIFISFILVCFVSCEKEVFTGVVENNVYEYGKLFVSSNPNGYKIYIDDRNSASKTPDTISWLTEGRHKLTLNHDIYIDSTIYVDVSKLSVQAVSINMLQNANFYSKVYCSTTPSGAKIYLNDQPTNLITPAIVTNIFPGQNKFKFSKNQCRDDSIVVNIKGRESKDVSRMLDDTSRTVNYSTNNSEISSNSAIKIVVDKWNNKWIGTVDHGLIKFDRKNWTSYENLSVIDGSRIQDLLIDKQGTLWVGTVKGLFTFDGITWKNITNYLPSNKVNALEEDIYGNIWIATSSELVKYNNNAFSIFTTSGTGTPLNLITSLAASNNGDLWIGTFGYGILKFSGNSWRNYLTNQMDLGKEVSNYIRDLIVDKNGILYSIHGDDPADDPGDAPLKRALLKFNNSEWMLIDLNLLFVVDMTSSSLDVDNNIWFTIKGGLIRYNESKPLKIFDWNTYGFRSFNCSSFCIDQNGDGWLTTLGGGITKLKKGNF